MRRGEPGYKDLEFIEEVWFGDRVTESMEIVESRRGMDIEEL